ncbi:hypothetical protein MMAGJ_43370 [Mycolicibacterium mageritense]|uniref:Transposase IS111A/IS1328/IS1533 N-terminal domain-containing protein n=1 Tax=Mycolicibacterium mageritense TaxID=53462 RepID=A0ABN5YBQ4_MYCME|nr:hypothetical protein MMAGJ_43370 [Mycolicibacterium mageritense]
MGIEDCRNMSARLERDLLGAGQKVVRVPTKLSAQTRKSARTRGKSDPIDAESVARAVLREPDLLIASHDEQSGAQTAHRPSRCPCPATHSDDQPTAVACA